MEKKKKQNLIIFSSVCAVVVATTLILFFVMKKQQKKDEIKKKEAEAKKPVVDDGYIRPTRNRNGELTNPMSEIKNKVLYSNKANTIVRTTPWINNPTALGFFDHNILSSAKEKDTPLGVIIGEAKGKENPQMRWLKIQLAKPIVKKVVPYGISSTAEYNPIVSLLSFINENANPYGNATGTSVDVYNQAWVRADVATFKPYKK